MIASDNDVTLKGMGYPFGTIQQKASTCEQYAYLQGFIV